MFETLRLASGNAKLSNDTLIFDIPAGFTCPAAKECLAFANKKSGKIRDGKQATIRCYAATQEAAFSNVRNKRWSNFELLKKTGNLTKLINLSISEQKKTYTKKVRIHSSGDFYSLEYFAAWIQVAKLNKDIIFYAYTKSVHFYNQLKDSIPNNFRVTCSLGGKYDNLIKLGQKTAKVFFAQEDAKKEKLKIDHDDSSAYKKSDKSFALLLHGTQPKGTDAGEAWKIIKKTVGGYSK